MVPKSRYHLGPAYNAEGEDINSSDEVVPNSQPGSPIAQSQSPVVEASETSSCESTEVEDNILDQPVLVRTNLQRPTRPSTLESIATTTTALRSQGDPLTTTPIATTTTTTTVRMVVDSGSQKRQRLDDVLSVDSTNLPSARWKNYMPSPSDVVLNERFRKKRVWNKAEDDALKEAVGTYGMNSWDLILADPKYAANLGRRNVLELRGRFASFFFT